MADEPAAIEPTTETPAETTPVAEPNEAPPVAEPTADESVAPAPAPQRRRGMLVAVILLSIGFVAAGAGLTVALLQLDRALAQIEQQLDDLDEQRDLIDQKETFSSAAQELMSTAAQLDGVPFATLVDTTYLSSLIKRGWTHRWTATALERDITEVREVTDELSGTIEAALVQASTNTSGTFFETTTDQLGLGYVATALDSADAMCEEDVWGCVAGDDPFTIHYDDAEMRGEPFMNDWLRTGLAYHEYAHVLQFTNPGPTAKAAEAFGGDWETMADCYALTVLPGWTLDHTIWTSAFEYWEVSVGYGYTCDDSQRDVIREWVASVGYVHEPISQ